MSWELYHELRRITRKTDRKYYDALGGCTKVDISDVSEYYWGQARDNWSIQDDIPCILPPWLSCFMEWDLRHATDPEIRSFNVRQGAFIHYAPRDADHGVNFSGMYAEHMSKGRYDIFPPQDFEYVVYIHMILQKQGMPPFKYVAVFYADKQGAPVATLNRDGNPATTWFDKSWQKRPDPREAAVITATWSVSLQSRPANTFQDIAGSHLASAWVIMPFLAITFANCRNLKVEDREMPPKLVKKHLKKHPDREPVVTWKELKIGPVKQLLAAHGATSGTGLKKALHLCRGHFKHFEEGKGLFGKIHGTYFWPMHMRGTKSQGEVKKSYAVEER